MEEVKLTASNYYIKESLKLKEEFLNRQKARGKAREMEEIKFPDPNIEGFDYKKEYLKIREELLKIYEKIEKDKERKKEAHKKWLKNPLNREKTRESARKWLQNPLNREKNRENSRKKAQELKEIREFKLKHEQNNLPPV